MNYTQSPSFPPTTVTAPNHRVIPAKAGILLRVAVVKKRVFLAKAGILLGVAVIYGIPAFAGMTRVGVGMTGERKESSSRKRGSCRGLPWF